MNCERIGHLSDQNGEGREGGREGGRARHT